MGKNNWSAKSVRFLGSYTASIELSIHEDFEDADGDEPEDLNEIVSDDGNEHQEEFVEELMDAEVVYESEHEYGNHDEYEDAENNFVHQDSDDNGEYQGFEDAYEDFGGYGSD